MQYLFVVYVRRPHWAVPMSWYIAAVFSSPLELWSSRSGGRYARDLFEKCLLTDFIDLWRLLVEKQRKWSRTPGYGPSRVSFDSSQMILVFSRTSQVMYVRGISIRGPPSGDLMRSDAMNFFYASCRFSMELWTGKYRRRWKSRLRRRIFSCYFPTSILQLYIVYIRIENMPRK